MTIELHCEIYPEIADRHPITPTEWQEWFETWAKYLHTQDQLEPENYELSLAITDDHVIQKFNWQYRQIDRPTDVLSFAAQEANIPDVPASMFDYAEPIYLGDIIISQTTAIRQAQEREHSLTYELAWLAAHGLLHLLGWDHPDDQSLMAMLEQQDTLLSLVISH
ncbi:MAG: rRNA maturation RNase YbeY [Pseudanabaenaceae cyanobacterium bins.39]|nr:rRNA maturation RNase YbeY [Pseudanabaenaceae cyanobacterium bins.39]